MAYYSTTNIKTCEFDDDIHIFTIKMFIEIQDKRLLETTADFPTHSIPDLARVKLRVVSHFPQEI